MAKRVCVVGAGPSGLPTAKWALEYGFTPVVFEATNSIGGLWNYKSDDTEYGTVMSFTVNNTSKELSCYSDFIPPEKAAPYMPWSDCLKYFKDYADHYGVTQHVRLNHKVLNIERSQDYDQNGKWDVHYQDGNGQYHSDTFEYVVVATGHHSKPNFPQPYPGQDKFKGRIIHSHKYKNNKGFEDQTIVVVGLGNSALDSATDTSRVAKQVYLSTRKGGYVLNKVSLFGFPLDAFLNRRIIAWVRQAVPSFYAWAAETYTNMMFNHTTYGMQPKHRITQQQPASSDDLYGRLIGGSVKVKGEIRGLTEHGVIFEDGEEITDVDCIIMATGWLFDLNLLEKGTLIPVTDNVISKGKKLWKRIFPIHLYPKNTLGMIGFFQPVGSVMPISELQARVFFEVISGSKSLPPPDLMKEDIEEADRKMAARYTPSTRHTLQVDYTEFMTELGDFIGCTPCLKSLFLYDPRLAWQVIWGVDSAYNYRLNGPKPWPQAREATLGTGERMFKGVHNRRTPSSQAHIIIGFGILVILIYILWIFIGNL